MAAASLLLGAACAGQQETTGGVTTSGGPVPRQLINVTTNPISAVCTLSGGGEEMGVVQGTPGTFSAIRNGADLTVRCTKDGYHPATEFLVPTDGGGVAARLIPARLAENLAGARAGRYPKQVTLYMTPTRFEDEYSRKQHGKLMRARIAVEADIAKQAVARDCRAGLFGGPPCARAERAIDDRAVEELRLLNQRLRAARIVPNR